MNKKIITLLIVSSQVVGCGQMFRMPYENDTGIYIVGKKSVEVWGETVQHSNNSIVDGVVAQKVDPNTPDGREILHTQIKHRPHDVSSYPEKARQWQESILGTLRNYVKPASMQQDKKKVNPEDNGS